MALKCSRSAWSSQPTFTLVVGGQPLIQQTRLPQLAQYSIIQLVNEYIASPNKSTSDRSGCHLRNTPDHSSSGRTKNG